MLVTLGLIATENMFTNTCSGGSSTHAHIPAKLESINICSRSMKQCEANPSHRHRLLAEVQCLP